MSRTTSSSEVSFSIKGTKLTNYLLDPNHLVGRAKAKFFLGHGFSAVELDTFVLALLNHTAHETTRQPTVHGLGFICEGPMATPNGTTPLVRSVWQQRHDAGTAELITAYPI